MGIIQTGKHTHRNDAKTKFQKKRTTHSSWEWCWSTVGDDLSPQTTMSGSYILGETGSQTQTVWHRQRQKKKTTDTGTNDGQRHSGEYVCCWAKIGSNLQHWYLRSLMGNTAESLICMLRTFWRRGLEWWMKQVCTKYLMFRFLSLSRLLQMYSLAWPSFSLLLL